MAHGRTEIKPGMYHDGHQLVHHQYESAEQQNDSYIIGMWSFLVTEVMFFGALFLAYSLYRWKYQSAFYEVHKLLDIPLGAVNTTILLLSSFTMACAVHFAQKKDKKKVLLNLGIVLACAFGFLVIKYFEWSHKIHVGLVPGANFTWTPETAKTAVEVSPNIAQMFFSLYYAMTGLHGLHVIIGIIIIGVLALMWLKDNPMVTEDYIPTELVGLYWHFVDLVWIFLFPLFYLLPQ